MNIIQVAVFAAGCFWCVESNFEGLPGVISVESGYIGGNKESANYSQVSSGKTDHIEAVRVEYNPDIISYASLVHGFWRQIDPTDAGGSFVDRGPQYASAIFYGDEKEKKVALDSLAFIQSQFKQPIVTKILPLRSFYEAEDYHQDYAAKNPVKYKFYRLNSGRDKSIQNIWNHERKNPACRIQIDTLTPLQAKVTQEDGTEPAFNNKYWDNKKEGQYADVVSGEPLFKSSDKYDSGTGWPSFSQPLDPEAVYYKKDTTMGMTRIEVRSIASDSHLGHVFTDGPPPYGLRYCINSAALSFTNADTNSVGETNTDADTDTETNTEIKTETKPN